MPVTFDSSASKLVTTSGSTGSVTVSHNVNPLAEDLVAVAGGFWIGNADARSSAFSVSFGGSSMPSKDGPIRWNANKSVLQAFVLEGPPTGSRSVVLSASGLPGAGQLYLCSVTYSNVASVGSAVD